MCGRMVQSHCVYGELRPHTVPTTTDTAYNSTIHCMMLESDTISFKLHSWFQPWSQEQLLFEDTGITGEFAFRPNRCNNRFHMPTGRISHCTANCLLLYFLIFGLKTQGFNLAPTTVLRVALWRQRVWWNTHDSNKTFNRSGEFQRRAPRVYLAERRPNREFKETK